MHISSVEGGVIDGVALNRGSSRPRHHHGTGDLQRWLELVSGTRRSQIVVITQLLKKLSCRRYSSFTTRQEQKHHEIPG